MNTCMGNGGMRNTVINSAGSNAQQNPMLLTYMSNHLEGDYGIWSDYDGWRYVFTFLMNDDKVVADEYIPATIKNAAGADIPNPLIGLPLIRKYVSDAEWTRWSTTAIWNSGKSPMQLWQAGDPRFLQWLGADLAANKPGTLGWFFGRGPAWIAKEGAGAFGGEIKFTPPGGTPQVVRKALPADYGLPELVVALDEDSHLHAWKHGHTLHHSIENQSQFGALVNAFQTARDMNNHTPQNMNTNGLPATTAKPVKIALAQEIACSKDTYFQVPDNSAAGEWAWNATDVPPKPMNLARAGMTAQAIISYELENSLTCCNYTLPVWASPLKSRELDASAFRVTEVKYDSTTASVPTPGYRGDVALDCKVFNAVTGLSLTQADFEKMGHRMYTLLRAYTARVMNARKGGTGVNMRTEFDLAPAWAFDPTNSVSTWGTLNAADWEKGKDLLYEVFGYDKATGQPTEAKLNELGLGFVATTLKAEHLIP
jgi:hypothetical protein